MNIPEIYEKSWNVAKNNKSLWIFGIVLGVLAGSHSYNLNGSDSGTSVEVDGENFTGIEKWLLGNGYNPDAVAVVAQEIFSNISIGVWVWLAFSVLLLVTISIFYWLFAWNWAEASLIGGIDLALKGGKADLSSSSKIGRNSVGRKIWLGLIIWLPLLLLLLFVSLLIIIAISAESLLLGLLGGLLLFGWIFLLVFLGFTQGWADRVLIIEGLNAIDSLKKGIKLFLKNFMETIVVSLLNCLLGCVVFVVVIGAIILGLGGFIVAGFLSSFGGAEVLIPFVGLSIIVVIPIVIIAHVASAAFTTFLYSTWNVLYNSGLARIGREHSEHHNKSHEKLDKKEDQHG